MKHGGCEARWMNPKMSQWHTLSHAGQRNLMSQQPGSNRSGNYCYSSIRVTSIDKKKETASERLRYIQNCLQNRQVNKGHILLMLKFWSLYSKNQLQNPKLNVFRCKWSPINGCTSIGCPARIYIHQLCVDTGWNLEDLPGMMGDRNGLAIGMDGKRESGNSLLSAWWYIYIYIVIWFAIFMNK